MKRTCAAELEAVARRLGSLVAREVPLGPLTTYRVGGAARLWCQVDEEAQLAHVARALSGSEVDVLVVGKGSNMLVADAGFDGLALQLGDAFAGIEIAGTTVHAGAAASLPVVARRTAAEGLTGFEWAVGVPGSVGGGVRMNAGGHGSDIAASLVGIRRFDLRTGEDREVPAAALELRYRSSALQAHHLALRATLALRPGDPATSRAAITDIVRWRRDNQPGGQNAGSVFTNPPGDSAGRLVEAAGCKGLRAGTAAVSDKHANFIQADPGGSADDVARLMLEVRRAVHDASGIVLVPETRLVGFDPRYLLEDEGERGRR
jgi:UDP-N-acetylmuramate dehydrogenase